MALLPGCYPWHPAVQLLCRPTGRWMLIKIAILVKAPPNPNPHLSRCAICKVFTKSPLFVAGRPFCFASEKLFLRNISVLLSSKSLRQKVVKVSSWHFWHFTLSSWHLVASIWSERGHYRVKCKPKLWDLKYKTLSLPLGQSSSWSF